MPPYQEAGLAAAVFETAAPNERPRTGRLVVHKRVHDQSNAARRFERRGFRFQLLDGQGRPVGEEFESDGTGRAVYDGELELGQAYTLNETHSPIPNVQPLSVPFDMDKASKQVQVENLVTQSDTPYGVS